MKKIIAIASALALFGSVSYAMEEEAMDEMMEAPALSVALGGSAKIGIKNVDDDAKPNADSIHLVREYKVTFSSSGTTDGGLMFGAGMSIIDEHEGGDDVKAVGGSHVYVGGADGSWKLQFGGNDPGALLAGGIGLADDRIDRGDADVSLSGSVQGVEYRLTMADPQKSSDDWSVGAKFGAGNIGVGVGMDSLDGLAIGVSTELGGLKTNVYYAKSESKVGITEEDGPMMYGNRMSVPASGDAAAIVGSIASDTRTEDGNGVVTYTYETPGAAFTQGDAEFGTGATPDPISRRVVVTYTGGDADTPASISAIVFAEADGSTATDVEIVPALVGTVTDYVATIEHADDGSPYLVLTDDQGEGTADDVVRRFALVKDQVENKTYTLDPVSGKWTGLGGKIEIPAGEGTTFTIGYSRMKNQVNTTDMGSGSATASKIELDFSYDLGGGATFNAGIDKDDTETLMIKTMDGKSSFVTKSSDKTTLEASMSFSF
ncbi:MAG: hypothetical protein OXH90_12185 [Paracoccaceae bacterium]|nr:hypothetical protein [Paracoccaceae bacterium]MDE2917071.1 hypothetical protein [Paracoccaceae bacterium]